MLSWWNCPAKYQALKKDYDKLKVEYEAHKAICPLKDKPAVSLILLTYRDYDRIVSQLPDVDNWYLDLDYYTCSQKDFLNIVYWDYLDRKQYVPEYFDCDDFAVLLKAHCKEYFNITVGLVLDWLSQHAYNAIVFSDCKLALIEPQNDSIFWVSERDKDMYKLNGALILW